jgi:glycosyltransferase involved in cell wall biosynthesis
LDKPYNWISEPDNGIYDAMNKGISLSTGNWLYFLGSDDKFADQNVLSELFSVSIPENIDILLGTIKYALKKDDSLFLKKNRGHFIPSWTNLIWLKNSIPHQAIFYRKNLFDHFVFSSQYKVLGDYDLNLKLYNNKKQHLKFDTIIAICDTNGISKNYDWNLYKEEIKLKSYHSSIVFKPFFFCLAGFKYIVKKII